jgi:hypothetical protein
LFLVPAARFASAQDAVDLFGGWGEWSGKNAEEFKGGYALGAAYIADLGLPLDLGVDVVFARTDTDGDQLTEIVDEFQAAAVLRRWIFSGGGALRPYLGARVGFTRLSADLEDLQFEQNGAFIGPQFGIVFPTGKTLSPLISVEALRVRYQDTTLFLEDLEIPQSGGYGWRFFVRVGVTFGSGRDQRRR